MKSTLKPLDPPYSKVIDSALKQYPQQDGYLLKLFRVFANSARFLAGKGVINFLDEQSPLTIRERELIILRVCANNNCEYEWGVHVSVFAEQAKLTQYQVEKTRDEIIGDDCWSDNDKLLLDVVDQLCAHGELLDNTLDSFGSRWTSEQQLEILALCGNYHTISFVANVSKVELEPFSKRFR